MGLQNTILEQLNWRYAVKKFDPTKKISEADWRVLEESLRLSASSYGLQPWQFIVVKDPAVRKKLTPVSWNQQQIENASHLVVLTYLKEMNEDYVGKYIKSTAKTRGISEESLKGYYDMMVGTIKSRTKEQIDSWNGRQLYIAMGSFLTAAALLKIDTCPMEGIDINQYNEILGLTKTPYTAAAVITAGYRAADDQMQFAKKSRFEKEEVIKVI